MVTIFTKIFPILLHTFRNWQEKYMLWYVNEEILLYSFHCHLLIPVWVPLQQCLGLQLDGEMYSEHFIKNEMTFEKQFQQVSPHPVACSRYFDHKRQQFYKYIIMGLHSPFGNVVDFGYRTEFQK